MLAKREKAYCRALLALKKRDYKTAMSCFGSADGDFGTNSEFNLLYQTTKLLLAVRTELEAKTVSDIETKKEMIING